MLFFKTAQGSSPGQRTSPVDVFFRPLLAPPSGLASAFGLRFPSAQFVKGPHISAALWEPGPRDGRLCGGAPSPARHAGSRASLTGGCSRGCSSPSAFQLLPGAHLNSWDA